MSQVPGGRLFCGQHTYADVTDEKLTSLLTLSDGEPEEEFTTQVVPILGERFGKDQVERMKLVQKLEGRDWAMVGFKMDGPGLSLKPRVFVYDPRYPSRLCSSSPMKRRRCDHPSGLDFGRKNLVVFPEERAESLVCLDD